VKWGGQMKKILVVVILAALVLAAFSVLSAPNVKADTSEVKVQSYSYYTAPSNTELATSAGDLVIVGEVQNVGSNTVADVNVTGIAYDSDGNTLATAQVEAFVYEMTPNQKAPFYIDFPPGSSSSSPTQSWVSLVSKVTISVASVTDSTVNEYSGLTIPPDSISHFSINDTLTVTGVVQNNGTGATGNVWIVATFYDASGTVVGLNYTSFLTSSLEPSAWVPFWATPADSTAQLSNKITNYTLLVHSEPLTISTSPSPSMLPGSSPTTSPTTSTAQLPTAILLSVILALSIALVVVTLLFLGKRRKLPPPPPPSQSVL
jgi:hypothetical protein